MILVKLIQNYIDSGNENTFLNIRGKNKFFDVFKNLSKYSQFKPENVVIKFIFTEGNLDLKEVVEFANEIKKEGFNKKCLSNKYRL